jgi:DsbC/DsbD-like thiol-disulfide interchange protein
MTSYVCLGRLIPAFALLAASWHSSLAQTSPALSIAPPSQVTIKRGGEAEFKLKAEVRPGFHVNSNAPNDEFLIPLKLTWPPGPIAAEQVSYPKPQSEHYAFSTNPVSVFSGNFEIVTRFKAAAGATPGLTGVTGKLRFQACNEKECLAPRTIDVRVTLDVQ